MVNICLHTDKGVLHKSVVFEGDVHIVEEIQLLKNSESIKNLLLSSEVSDCRKIKKMSHSWAVSIVLYYTQLLV